MWSKKFLALSGRKKYKDLLTGITTTPPAADAIDVSQTGGPEKQKAQDENEMAYHNLVLANPNKVAFNIINNATTTDLPDGDAALAWKRLSGKYESKSATNVVDLVRKFSQSRLTSLNKDPDEWIVDLEIMKARLDDMNYPITDTSFFIHVLNNLPEEYDSIVEADEQLLTHPTTPLTLELLRDHLHRK